MISKNQVSGQGLSRAQKNVRMNEEDVFPCQRKFNYATGAGWCKMRDQRQKRVHRDIKRKGTRKWESL